MSKLAKAVIDFITKRVDRVAVKLPAVVTLLNSDNTVNLKILTKEFDKQTGLYVEQQLFDVAVDFPASYEDAYLRLPVKVGTTGTITIFDNDISGLMNGGNETPVEVDTPRRHNLADCKFKPDFQTQKKTIAIDDNAEFRNKDMKIILYPNGKIEIKGASKEVLSVVSDFMAKTISNLDVIVNDQHIKAVVGKPVTHSQTLVENWSLPVFGLKALMEADKDNLDTLKVT